MRIKNALISVSDKSGLPELGAALEDAGVAVYSTGGTAAALRTAGITVKDLSALTGVAEMLDGRVKTLHPRVHAALLADMANEAHRRQLEEMKTPKFDLLVVNFYPFEKTVATTTDEAEVIENIDIGGPAMLRAAAKNFSSTAVLSDPSDYPLFIGDLKENAGAVTLENRRLWAMRAFIRVAHLDAAIANYFSAHAGAGDFPAHRFLHLEKILNLPYGENPHQPAACYGIAGSDNAYAQLQGAPASYNNLLDAYSASMTVGLHDAPAAAIIKHNNPCGVAVAPTLKGALVRALRTDSLSAYGGIVAFNRPLDGDTAQVLQNSFWEVVIAPQFEAAAKSVLAGKPRLRLLISSLFSGGGDLLSGHGPLLLMQKPDALTATEGDVKSKRPPTENERRDLNFAWAVAAAVKSNAIVLAKDGATVGIGAGQMSRVDSAWLACEKARRAKIKIKGAVAASDGFFPFADGLEILAKAGVTAVIQPGGSKNDDDIVAAADALGLAVIFTGRRHFRH